MALLIPSVLVAIIIIIILVFALRTAIKSRNPLLIAYGGFMSFLLLFLGIMFIDLSYDTYREKEDAKVAERELQTKYELDNLAVWYNVRGFNFTEGTKSCKGKLAKTNGHYDIAKKPN